MSANVTTLAAAYISGGQAVAMAGWNLDVNGHAVSLTLITATGPVTVSALVVGGCDMLSSNYVANTSGWKIFANGTVEFQSAVFRGTIQAGTTFPSGMPIGVAPDPVLQNPGSPNIRVAAPGSPPAGYTVRTSVNGGPSTDQSSFPFTITTGGVNVPVSFQAFATGYTPGPVNIESWNSLFL
jgi:hypothetical protein